MRVKMRSGVKRLRCFVWSPAYKIGMDTNTRTSTFFTAYRLEYVDNGVLVSVQVQVGVIYTVHTYFNYSLNFVCTYHKALYCIYPMKVIVPPIIITRSTCNNNVAL